MSILKIARMGHPILRAKARTVDPQQIATPFIRQLIADMIETLQDCRGVGLAAPQVHQDMQVIVVRSRLDDPGKPAPRAIVLINPQVIAVGPDVIEDWEGCVSVPGVQGLVPRVREVAVSALDESGSPIELQVRDLAARIIQHERDHLDGLLFFDRMRSFESLTFLDSRSPPAPTL